MSIRVTQSCPTCGRRVQVRAALLGYDVVCPHCQSEFRAVADPHHRIDGPNGSRGPNEPQDPNGPLDRNAILMDRVERALAQTQGDSAEV